MKVLITLLLAVASTMAAPETRFSCSECVNEMHHLGFLINQGHEAITAYLQTNYCPTSDDVEECEEHLAFYYPHMLGALVQHYFVDGAVHVCQTMGICEARAYTCDECVQGLEWVEAYVEDPIMVAEMMIWLEQNFCINEWEGCKEGVAKYFQPMHIMAMEKFMIPTEICNQEPVCTGETHPPHPTHPQ
eukprot:TRINITY_DN2793_c0_g1_i1.p1 TRINITY_DN2793_c0_g1~~TRINITY_DN2793_c0_g1_i1.p1  ORF type:complete len:189 (-),score=64.79 TRINITY_DN2793_c0_g1_i1:50-616(-)